MIISVLQIDITKEEELFAEKFNKRILIYYIYIYSRSSFERGLGPCQTSSLAAAVAKRLSHRETAFERVYIDSFVKRWLMSHERCSCLIAAAETHFPT